jgi:proton glutamate symport protein
MEPKPSTQPPERWYHLSLGKQMLIGLVVGTVLGWAAREWYLSGIDATTPKAVADAANASLSGFLAWITLVRDIFLHLIQMMIAPLVFSSIVQGIAGHEDMKKVGRIGVKSLVYFEVLTGLALAVGLLMVNLLRPGAGAVLPADAGSVSAMAQNKPLTVIETILHIFPKSIIDAMARGDVLEIVAFSVIFALAISAAGEAGKPILAWCDSLRQVMFKFAGLIMTFAPFGVGAAIATTVGQQGLHSLLGLGLLLMTLYLSLAIFVVAVMGTVIWLVKIPLKPFVRAVRDPFILAFATANSEAALPDAFARMERFGVPRGIVGFVLPMGYSFNLDGSTLYLAVASVFIAQASQAATGVHFGLGQQIGMMLTLMLTSKGVAAVPRASLVVLIAALQSFNLPLAGAALILGVDAFMDMARTSVNVLGNCLASVVIARWEGEFDAQKAEAEFGDATLDLKPDY